MKKYYFLIIVALILCLVLTGCTLLSNISQVPATDQSGITYLTKNPSPPGLVGLWHFDGNANDSSGNGHNGTVHGDPTYAPGVFGSALSVNGNDYIAVGNIGVTADWTVEFWAQLASTTQTIYYPVGLSPKVGTVWGSGTYMAFQWQEDKWGVYDGTNTVPGSAVLTGTWYYMAVTKFGTTYTLYRDGAYENSGSLTDIDITDLNIGRRSDGYWYFNGLIDEVRIWNRALTDIEIAYNYSLGDVGIDIKPQSCPNPLNVKNQGVLPVAILGTENFDVNEIDPATVLLKGKYPIRWALEDVATPYQPFINETDCSGCTTAGPDGYMDLTLKFDTQEILCQLGLCTTELFEESQEINNGDCVELMLMGNLNNGVPFVGKDVVLIIKKGK